MNRSVLLSNNYPIQSRCLVGYFYDEGLFCSQQVVLKHIWVLVISFNIEIFTFICLGIYPNIQIYCLSLINETLNKNLIHKEDILISQFHLGPGFLE